MSDDQKTYVEDLTTSSACFSQIPNIIHHMGLGCYIVAYYCLLKAIAEEKKCCFMSQSSIASLLGCSKKQIQLMTKFMERPFSALGGKSLIKVIRRKTEKNEKETNVIQIVDIWVENITAMKDRKSIPKTPMKEKEVTIKEKFSSEPGSLPSEPGSDKEQPFKEDRKRTNKQPDGCDVVVCSSSIQEKRKILEPYRLSESLIRQFLNLSVEHLKDSIAAFEQYRSAKEAGGGKVDNPTGALRNAIIGSWKPNVTKADKEKEKASHLNSIEERIKNNHKIAKELFEKYCDSFHSEFEFIISDNIVSLKYKERHYCPLALNDENFSELLEYYIESRIGK